MTYNVNLVSLGCAKNLIDSEIMLGLIEENNYNLVDDPNDADIIIINTCGFIEAAKEESINMILEYGQLKNNKLKVLISTGCLSERYREELLKEIPELDGVIGTGDYSNIVSIIKRTLSGERICAYGHIDYKFDESLPRKLTTPRYTAYVKIGDGCDNHCTYCIIPNLRGKFRSRMPKDIISEIETLVKNGVKEVILIAQDVTQYGVDLGADYSLSKLLKEIDNIKDLKWLRLLYVYPENIDDKLIDTIKMSDKILHYLDIPLQHTEDNMLKRMARRTTKKRILKLIKKLRKEIPDITIRSTIITGFPGETEEDFYSMFNTIKNLKIDRLGVFPYSLEEGTSAAKFKDQVPDEVKISRQQEVMIAQQEISFHISQEKIGSTLEVLIEGSTEDTNVYEGRSYMDSPEIDGIIYVYSENSLKQGDIINVHITDALEYDLIGEKIYGDESTQ